MKHRDAIIGTGMQTRPGGAVRERRSKKPETARRRGYDHSPELLSPSTKILQFYEFVILSDPKDLHTLRVGGWPPR